MIYLTFRFSLIVKHYDLFKLIIFHQILKFNINQIKSKSLNPILLEKNHEISGRVGMTIFQDIYIYAYIYAYIYIYLQKALTIVIVLCKCT